MNDTAPPEPTSAAPSTHQSNKRGAIILACILLGAPLLLLLGKDCGTPEGSLRVEGGPHPAFTLTPRECDSLQPLGRMGAGLHDKGHNDGAVYATVDPLEGTRLDVEIPGSCQGENGTDCTLIHMERTQCTRFEVLVEPTDTTINNVRLVRGHVRVDCTLPDQTHVVGELTFDDC